MPNHSCTLEWHGELTKTEATKFVEDNENSLSIICKGFTSSLCTKETILLRKQHIAEKNALEEKHKEQIKEQKKKCADAQLVYNNTNPFATLKWPKESESVKHRSHFAAYITSYARITTIQQLFKIEYDDVVRVCVDGIYFNDPTNKYRLDGSVADKVYSPAPSDTLKLIGSFIPDYEKYGNEAKV